MQPSEIKKGVIFTTYTWKASERIELKVEALCEPYFEPLFGLVVDHTLVDNSNYSYWNEITRTWESV